MRLARTFKPAHEGSGVASVVKALEGVCRRHDPARRRKPLKDAHPVSVEVLRLIHQYQRKTTSHPFLNGFVFQKASRQSARPVKFAQSIGVLLHRRRNQAPAPRSHSPGEHIEGLAIEAPAERRAFAKARIQTAARAVHEGERQELVPFAEQPVVNEFSRSAHEIVGLARTRRTFIEIERHGGTKRKTCMSAVESAAIRVKSGVLTFAGSRSTAHKALSNCAARVRQGALAISVMAALSWVGA